MLLFALKLCIMYFIDMYIFVCVLKAFIVLRFYFFCLFRSQRCDLFVVALYKCLFIIIIIIMGAPHQITTHFV